MIKIDRERFDSDEELWFAHWCEELKLEGYIKHWSHEGLKIELTPDVFIPWQKKMKTKVKIEERKLLQGSSYMPDFFIEWSEKADGLFCWEEMGTYENNPYKMLFSVNGVSIVEIKPSFDQNNMTRLVRDRIKQAYTQGYFVNLVKSPDYFKDSFTPERYFYTPSGNSLRKKKGEVLYHSDKWPSLSDFLTARSGQK